MCQKRWGGRGWNKQCGRTFRLYEKPAAEKRVHLSQILLHEFRADDADEGCSGVVGHSLGQHGLAGAGGSPQQHPPRGVDADLAVQLVVSQRQLHRLLYLLLLDVVASDVLQAWMGANYFLLGTRNKESDS